ncbi:TonB-dependent receptor [Flavobacteriaceae bacterium]|nr:TonB-dependent receptor [Flavobacteriaceae bacterium]
MKNTFKTLLIFSLLSLGQTVFSQDTIATQNLKEVVVSSGRIDVPLSENSRTLVIIGKSEIKNAAATNLADLLQSVAGVDVRRRGAGGQQADLYIRGGSFDQTLLLIDGIKVYDPQTGHHTLNMALPIELIERIEIVKGPSARIFGQNAFTGAINIVTKKTLDGKGSTRFSVGSFNQFQGAFTSQFTQDNSDQIVHFSRNSSQGYRYNTDFKNNNFFTKSTFNKDQQAIVLMGTFMDRSFGANGFYATPSAEDQFERTQASLVSVQTVFTSEDWVVTPSVYWKRNQDLYIFIRNNPGVYRNLHLSNKVGSALMARNFNALGISGFGLELAQVSIRSNNLGNRERFQANGFVEHRFSFFEDQLDVTPGVALNYFSDFKFHAFPGIDIGYRFNNDFKTYANFGYTYRIPTYTDLFYADRTSIGNENLAPEQALSWEFGAAYIRNDFTAQAAFFRRDTDNLIDYVKFDELALWEAQNFAALATSGVEINLTQKFDFMGFQQQFSLGYTYIDDAIKDTQVPFSRYAINSLKHQLTANTQFRWAEQWPMSISYRYMERTNGISYQVLDAALRYETTKITWSLVGNNILDARFSETNLVPAPGVNVLFSMTYQY